MKLFRLLFICAGVISFTTESAYLGGEELTLLDKDGTFLCPANTDCVISSEEELLSDSDNSTSQSRAVSTSSIGVSFPSILASSINPKDIYVHDTVRVIWQVSSAGGGLHVPASCKVMLNNSEIASGGYIGSVDFTAENDGVIEILCASGGYKLKRTHQFTVKTTRPAPVVTITGPSGLHEFQSGEFRWSIQNAEQCERFDSLGSQRVAIGAGNGNARLAWGGVPYQWVTVTIECTGAGGFAAADASVYIIPQNVANPVAPKIKSFIVRSTSAFKATGSWITERMSSCNLSSNHVGSYNKMPVPVNTPVGGYAGLNTGGTTLEVFTLECFGEDGKTYRMNARPY
ncbi:hypothetical protein [Rheinheimera pacifica]|uniref:hypothetical protein n=1 Tax=Rheinheimera pacifica TaxID=173990 RepID=UPI002ED9961A